MLLCYFVYDDIYVKIVTIIIKIYVYFVYSNICEKNCYYSY